MTAAERLRQLAGTTGSAAALLLAIGVGASAGEALNSYSSIDSGTAADHLLSEVVKTSGTEQGRAAIRFIPAHGVEVHVVGCGVHARSGGVDVESSRTTEISVPSLGASARTSCVEVKTVAVAQVFGVGARSGAGDPLVSANAVVGAASGGSRACTGRVFVSGGADAVPLTAPGFAGSVRYVGVVAIQNPTDEELLLLFRRLTANV